jgi:hypothetical protein
MAFVNEKITDDERAKYSLDNLENAYGRIFDRWLIDRERDVFLVQMEVDQEAVMTFWLYFDGAILTINGREAAGTKKHELVFEVRLDNAKALNLLTEAIRADHLLMGIKNPITVRAAAY